jgi:cyclic pyranopterin monophosphate synthase
VETQLTHLDASGRARMVDVGGKTATERYARARAVVRMSAEAAGRVARGDNPKGDVAAVARIAAIQAAKRVPELIPLAHPVAVSRVAVDFELQKKAAAIVVRARVECCGPTGVEMEALTAVAIGLLTIYDMVKAVDRGMTLGSLRLEEKLGGKSGVFRRAVR